MRLVDADELRELYNEHIFDRYKDYSFAIDTLDYMPTVDAVPVVRCKDCKHRMTELSDDRKTRCYCPLVDHYTVNDWFCADGERRDDADE